MVPDQTFGMLGCDPLVSTGEEAKEISSDILNILVTICCQRRKILSDIFSDMLNVSDMIC